MEDDTEVISLMIDNGSYLLKAGISGEDSPRTFISNQISFATATSPLLVGDQIAGKKGPFDLRFPLERGVIVDWEAMEQIWTYMFFNEQRMPPEEHPCHITDAPLNPPSHRERLIQVFFESFNVPGFYVSLPSVLALYASGRTTGLVLDSGESITSAVPVENGHALTAAIQRVDIAGRDLTEYLWTIMKERGRFADIHSMEFTAGTVAPGSCEWDVVRTLKERLCFAAIDGGSELGNASNVLEKSFQLPDGQSVSLGVERFLCSELMFQPAFAGQKTASVPQLIASAIRNSPETLQKDLYANIVLSGGNTMFPSIWDRIREDIAKEVPLDTRFKVIAPPERQVSTWIGGSILSSLSIFPEMWVTRREYQEFGCAIVHRKCF